jgi:hypothetical protein
MAKAHPARRHASVQALRLGQHRLQAPQAADKAIELYGERAGQAGRHLRGRGQQFAHELKIVGILRGLQPERLEVAGPLRPCDWGYGAPSVSTRAEL